MPSSGRARQRPRRSNTHQQAHHDADGACDTNGIVLQLRKIRVAPTFGIPSKPRVVRPVSPAESKTPPPRLPWHGPQTDRWDRRCTSDRGARSKLPMHAAVRLIDRWHRRLHGKTHRARAQAHAHAAATKTKRVKRLGSDANEFATSESIGISCQSYSRSPVTSCQRLPHGARQSKSRIATSPKVQRAFMARSMIGHDVHASR